MGLTTSAAVPRGRLGRRDFDHLVPVLFETGTRMFEDLHKGHVRLQTVDALSTPSATHLRYRIVT
jgi:hypothetical protein